MLLPVPLLLAASLPDWARAVSAAPLTGLSPREKAVVLLDQWDITVKDGSRSGERRFVVKILAEKGRDYASLVVARGAFQGFRKAKLWVASPSGEVTVLDEDDGSLASNSRQESLDDTEVLHLEPPWAGPGTTIAAQYQFSRSADIPQDLFEIQREIPVQRAVVTIDANKGWRVRARVVAGENPGPSDVTGESRWEFTSVPARPRPQALSAREAPRTLLALDYVPPKGESVFRDWAATARWGLELFRLDDKPSPALEAAAASIRSKGGDPVAETGRFVRRMRYFGVEIGWGGYRPRTPETTLSRAFGDCKDKSHLMVALLRILGVPAVPVLVVAASDRYVHDEIAGPTQFNHCIVGLPSSSSEARTGRTFATAPGVGMLRLFDPTLPESAPEDTSVGLEAGTGLVLDARTTGLVRLASSEAAHNLEETLHDWKLAPDDAVQARAIQRFCGVTRVRLLGDNGVLLSERDLRRQVQRTVSERFPSIEALEVSEVRTESDGCWVYEYLYRVPHAVADFGKMGVLPTFPLIPFDLIPVPDEEKEGSLFLENLVTYRDRFAVDVGGRSVSALSEPFMIENFIGRVSLATRREEGRVVIEREITVVSPEITFQRRLEAVALRRALRRLDEVPLVLDARQDHHP